MLKLSLCFIVLCSFLFIVWSLGGEDRQSFLSDSLDLHSSHNIINSIVDEFMPRLEPFEDIYRDIHQNPELGTQEQNTSSKVAKHLEKVGYEVTSGIGGYGVVGVLKNRGGPTVMLRADMDALPIRENTGLPYASTVEVVNPEGERTPVMHACGHDMHTTSMLAVSKLLMEARNEWSGTLVVLFQPNEENGAGARAMLKDGLYDKIVKPDIVLGQHISPVKAGVLRIRPGIFMASADTFKVTVFGKGAHAAEPQNAIDPVVLAANIVVRLQTVVARDIAPADIVSITCASIHGGAAYNVIPDHVELSINIRTFDSEIRKKVLAAVKRIIRGEAIASGVEKEPDVLAVSTFPTTVNDDEASNRLKEAFTSFFGEEDVWEAPLITASEDFSLLATDIDKPSVFWNFGSIDVGEWERAGRANNISQIPWPHSSKFKPAIQPTMRTAVSAMSLAALSFLSTEQEHKL